MQEWKSILVYRLKKTYKVFFINNNKADNMSPIKPTYPQYSENPPGSKDVEANEQREPGEPEVAEGRQEPDPLEEPAPTVYREHHKEAEKAKVGELSDEHVVARMIAKGLNDNDSEKLIRASASSRFRRTEIEHDEKARRIEKALEYAKTIRITAEGCELNQEQEAEIKAYMLEPILRGHNPEIIGSLPTTVKVVKSEELPEAETSHGYSGVMFYNPDNNSVVIGYDLLGKENLDLRHMITHEIAHPLVEVAFCAEMQLDTTRGEIKPEELSFAGKVISMAQESESLGIPQTQHIRTVLKGLKEDNLADAYQKRKAEYKGSGKAPTYQEFKNKRLIDAQREILTDYTAVYLESDGSKDDFVRQFISKLDSHDFREFLTQGIKQKNPEMPDEEITKRVSTELAAFAKMSQEEREKFVETDLVQFAKFKELLGEFYELARERIAKGGENGFGKRAEEVSGANKRKNDLASDYDDYWGGGYYDNASGFGQNNRASGTQGKDAGIIETGKELLGAFASQVDIFS